jgi:hypothetical protein
MAEHGTVAMYKVHRRAKEGACQPCKDANARAQDELRKNPEVLARIQKRARAIQRANTRLKNTFLAEWEVFYQEELRREDG